MKDFRFRLRQNPSGIGSLFSKIEGSWAILPEPLFQAAFTIATALDGDAVILIQENASEVCIVDHQKLNMYIYNI